ncbi:MAG: winged helix-turn-helix domain-containing protein [Methyloglobulus sp.]|nr:winged helix-turn-helix domain-containing protein [Methyloglobulus sp.]
MSKILFILILIFVIYIIYLSKGKQKKVTTPPVSQAKPEEPLGFLANQEKLERPVNAVKSTMPKVASKNTKAMEVDTETAVKASSLPETVGMVAGTIWDYLDKNGPTTVAKMLRELTEDDKTIQRSIGWLAQENKIILKTIDRAETISLKEGA